MEKWNINLHYIATYVYTDPTHTYVSVQKYVQFGDRIPSDPSKHVQICQWVNHNWTNPPLPPPGYHTSSDGSGPALFSFPSSPVTTPATTPPNLDEDFDSLSVQLNVPKEVNAAMEDARRLISDGNSWNRRESVNSNGITWGGAPKGLCFKYWNSGMCHIKSCKFHHVRNPAMDVSYICVCLNVWYCSELHRYAPKHTLFYKHWGGMAQIAWYVTNDILLLGVCVRVHVHACVCYQTCVTNCQQILYFHQKFVNNWKW